MQPKTINFEDGERFEGRLDKDKFLNGTFYHNNGQSFTGDFENNKRKTGLYKY